LKYPDWFITTNANYEEFLSDINIKTFLKYPDWFITTNANYEEFLSDINIKTLLIWGDNDPVSLVQVGQYLNQKFENSTLYVVKGGDHQLAEKYADEVAVQIKNYLKGLM
ncbi:alpha/beta fold hydrolase, partial [Acinetobacter baumannii]